MLHNFSLENVGSMQLPVYSKKGKDIPIQPWTRP
jgi:hypothetical protein